MDGRCGFRSFTKVFFSRSLTEFGLGPVTPSVREVCWSVPRSCSLRAPDVLTRDTSPSKRGLLTLAVLPPLSAPRPFLMASWHHVELQIGRRHLCVCVCPPSPPLITTTRAAPGLGEAVKETNWRGSRRGCSGSTRPGRPISADFTLAQRRC